MRDEHQKSPLIERRPKDAHGERPVPPPLLEQITAFRERIAKMAEAGIEGSEPAFIFQVQKDPEP